MLRVGVVGAGAAGLVAARLVAAGPDAFAPPVVFEQSPNVGGTWVYTESTGSDKHGLPIHSSMYQNLRTNLPKEVMGFPDYPFKPDSYNGKSYIFHEEVLDYLESYTKHFDLMKYIRFETLVERITPLNKSDTKTGWMVVTRDLNTNARHEHQFDALLICIGHYSVPNVPDLPGQAEFGGEVTHSHDYRTPEPYTGKCVLLLGARASGIDISLEVSKVANKVYLSHNKAPLPAAMPGNLEQVAGIESLRPGVAVLRDGRTVGVDAIVFCTGYQFAYPFLSPDCGILVENCRVQPLYKHLVNTRYPRMAFVGVPFRVIPFPLFHKQVEYFLASLRGRLTLPSQSMMDEETAADLRMRAETGLPAHHAHFLGPMQWEYLHDLTDTAGTDPLPAAVQHLYNAVALMRSQQPAQYKDQVYRITGPDMFVQLVSGDVTADLASKH